VVGSILCFGDSNTYGWHEDGRFAADVRWPGVLRSLLPAGWAVIEEGLGGRTTMYDDPEVTDANGLAYLEPCLHSHVPLDVVVFFLGVNDLKPRLGLEPADIGAGMAALVRAARDVGVPRVLALAVAPLAAAYRALDVEVIDVPPAAFRADDPMHLDAAGHRLVGEAVAAALGLGAPAVRELRLVVTADDYDDALRFYRDSLGLREREAYTSPDGRVTILDAGRATLELADPNQAAFIDRVEVGRRVAGHLRVAFEVADSAAAAQRLVEAGAELVAPPTETPWRSLNARLGAPAGLQLTLFQELA
jgi:lysophospholipase L1-like esterase/predicted enzyme related to lactoylglutathione lyase